MSMFGYTKGMPDPVTYGKQQLEGAGRVLDMPLNTVQGALAYDEPMLTGAMKGLTGQKDYTGLDAFSPEFQARNPEVAAGLAVVSDMFLDPTMYVGLGGAKKAAQGVQQAAKEARGGVMATPSNYIDYFYGYNERKFWPEGYTPARFKKQMATDPSSVPEEFKAFDMQRQRDLALADQLLAQPKVAKAIKARTGMLPKTEEQKIAFAKKTQGLMDWAANSAKAADEMLPIIGGNREAKDLWRDTGISQNGQKLINEALDKYEATGDSSHLKKAIAQAQYMGHINHQAMREGTIHPALQKIMDKSYIDGYQAFDVDNYAKSVSKQTYFRDGKEFTPEEDVVKRMFSLAENAWDKAGDLPKDRTNLSLVVKEHAGITGEHKRDATGGNRQNVMTNNLSKIFESVADKGGFTSSTVLKDEAKKKGLNVVGRDKNGIYVQSSFHSESYTEGGVNVVSYVKNNGEYYSVISDVHNFLEKLPVAGKALKKVLPQDVIAVTPPIVGNVLNRPSMLKKGSRGGAELQMGDRVNPYATLAGGSYKADEVVSDLRAIASASPTGAAAKADTETGLNFGLFTGVSAYKAEDEQE